MRYHTLLPFLSAVLAAPTVQDATPEVFNKIPADVFVEKHIANSPQTPGATIVTLRYGPYRVKAKSMIENPKLPATVKAPCTSCYITAMEADMEYKDGRKANIDTGAWLHHMVLYNSLGVWGKKDPICTGSKQAIDSGVPTAAIGYPNRIFASGNERGAVRLNGKYKYGLPMDPGDGIYLLYELVNESNKDEDYYIVMKYETIPFSDKTYKRAAMAWMDITDCGNSEAPAQEGFYELKSKGWKSTYAGKLLTTLGHTHDGGEWTTLYINSKPVCKSLQFYNTRAGYKDVKAEASTGGMAGMAGMAGMNMKRHGEPMASNAEHISDVSSCVDFGRVEKGDLMQIGATYNTSNHGLQNAMLHGGSGFAPIMGIDPVYIGLD